MHRNIFFPLSALLLALGMASAQAEPSSPQDSRGAVALFRLGAEAGNARAQYDLAIAYLRGQGVQQDDTKAAHWLSLSANHGYAPAQTDLAAACLTGNGVAQDPAAAVRWLRLAVDQGYERAFANLGWFYENGLGVKIDKVLAYALYATASRDAKLAAAATQNRDGVARTLNPAQLAAAQTLARDLQAGRPLYIIDHYQHPGLRRPLQNLSSSSTTATMRAGKSAPN
jgi:TPR repeat protein